MRVADLMSRGVITIEVSASAQDALERMYRNKVRHLPVVGPDGLLQGVVTDRDLRHHLFARGAFEHDDRTVGEMLRAVAVREIMSSPAVTAAPDEPVEEAARRMLEDKIGSMPVVEQGRPVGMITETDLLRQIVRADACTPDVEYIVVSYP